MKKSTTIILIFAILCVALTVLFAACKKGEEVHTPPTETTVTTAEITTTTTATTMPETSATGFEGTPRLQFLTQEEILKLARQTHIPILSEVLYFLEEEAIESFAVTLLWRNVWELETVEIISLTDDESRTQLKMTTENEIRYAEVDRQGHTSFLYTVEQWELLNKHRSFFSGEPNLQSSELGLLAILSIQEIVEIEKIYDVDEEWERQQSTGSPEWAVVIYLRVTDIIGDVYYVGLSEEGWVQRITRGAIIGGEVVYSARAGFP